MEIMMQEEVREQQLVQKSIRLTQQEADRIENWEGKNFNDKFNRILKHCMEEGDFMFLKVMTLRLKREKLINEIYLLRRTADQLDVVFDGMNSVNKLLGRPFSISKWRKLRNEALPRVEYTSSSGDMQPKTIHTTVKITRDMELWINDWSEGGFNESLDEMFKICFEEDAVLRKDFGALERMRERLLKQVRMMKMIGYSISSLMDRLDEIVTEAADNCEEVQEEYAITGREGGSSGCRS